ncbi:hypothetical protein CANTEDRAFT_113480 [Yamadazyma tenuis ATCC 10573]|uniref:Mitochondrial distribution and morphology protein 10 n=2 Tax=Candida tenuis TaxID=2315449 RepID=G3B2J4_CANTC|nr:uncharacterized protein CANTEDRAFT_113480 [Yamadazyma tenuis ATCC 10573]EGV64692.1 hypothetical protein CANTEDRAFT_113480 [Yamadazyma tenuis ATCC 10573]
MEYLQKCFYKTTGWSEDNIFPNITSNSQAILDFSIPNGCKLDISSKSSDYSASSFTLSNYNVINGSLAYLYSSIPLKNTLGTKNMSLQEALSGFKIIEPKELETKSEFSAVPSDISKPSLLYGRMYFPGSALEAMVIKRISKSTQLLIKSISNPNLSKNGTMIIYLQNNTSKLSREFIYSTNEALIGFRCLYNFGQNEKTSATSAKFSGQHLPIIPKLDNSVVSIGTEIWYAAMTLSPGLSTAFRYSTRSTTTGKPLTMTIACNPILGQLSSTYTVKTSVASTFSSRYEFNLYSYASNLSLGFELYNLSKQPSPYNDTDAIVNSSMKISPNSQSITISPGMSSIDVTGPEPPIHKQTVMAVFQNLVKQSDFSSVLKFSTSLNDRMIKLLWEGRCKDFLVSAGTRISLNPNTNQPEFNKLGVSFSYAC